MQGRGEGHWWRRTGGGEDDRLVEGRKGEGRQGKRVMADYTAHDRTMCSCVDFVGRESSNMAVVMAAPICKEEIVECCLVMFRGMLGSAEQRPRGGVDIRC